MYLKNFSRVFAFLALLSISGLSGTVFAQFDMDLDGDTDADDRDLLCMVISSGFKPPVVPWMDLDGDGDFTPGDMEVWNQGYSDMKGWAHPVSCADANLDGAVDTSDFNIWNNNKFTNANEKSRGDFNCDGVCDVADYNVWNGAKFTVQR